jgi:dipeptidyl aminopeptidase/acylaminoacyl peptidase
MNSAGYLLSPDLSQLSAPILILHGTADAPADGGSSFTDVSRARAFEAAVRAARKPVEAHYYRGGTHNGMFANRLQRQDVVRRILRFMHQHLR